MFRVEHPVRSFETNRRFAQAIETSLDINGDSWDLKPSVSGLP